MKHRYAPCIYCNNGMRNKTIGQCILCCQWGAARYNYLFARKFIVVALRYKFCSSVFTHVNRPEDRFPRKHTGENKSNGITRETINAAKFNCIAFHCTPHISYGKFSFVRALYPVAILLNKQDMFAGTAEKFNVRIPSPGNICGRSLGFNQEAD